MYFSGKLALKFLQVKENYENNLVSFTQLLNIKSMLEKRANFKIHPTVNAPLPSYLFPMVNAYTVSCVLNLTKTPLSFFMKTTFVFVLKSYNVF